MIRMMGMSAPMDVGIVFLMIWVANRGVQLVKTNLSSIKLIPLPAFSIQKMRIAILGITMRPLARCVVMSVGGVTAGIMGNVSACWGGGLEPRCGLVGFWV